MFPLQIFKMCYNVHERQGHSAQFQIKIMEINLEIILEIRGVGWNSFL